MFDLTSFLLPQDCINDRIREVLADCWKRRDPSGGLPDPEDSTGYPDPTLLASQHSAVHYCKLLYGASCPHLGKNIEDFVGDIRHSNIGRFNPSLEKILLDKRALTLILDIPDFSHLKVH
jgi:hypothetical protein